MNSELSRDGGVNEADADHSAVPSRIRSLIGWTGAGRKLTQTGRLTLADARVLVGLLDTGDVIDPVVGSRVFRTTSSEELRYLNLLVEWSKAAGLARVVWREAGPGEEERPAADRSRRPVDGPVRLFRQGTGPGCSAVRLGDLAGARRST